MRESGADHPKKDRGVMKCNVSDRKPQQKQVFETIESRKRRSKHQEEKRRGEKRREEERRGEKRDSIVA